MWSIGVIIYILLCGYPPFYADNAPALFKKIMDVKYDFDDPSWDEVSDEAKDLIRHLLVKNPEDRYTAIQCKKHPWVMGEGVRDSALKPRLYKLAEHQAKAVADIDRQKQQALSELRAEVAALAVGAAEKILRKEIDADQQRGLVDQFIADLPQN